MRQADSIAFAKLASSKLQTYVFVSGFTQLQNLNKLIFYGPRHTAAILYRKLSTNDNLSFYLTYQTEQKY